MVEVWGENFEGYDDGDAVPSPFVNVNYSPWQVSTDDPVTGTKGIKVSAGSGPRFFRLVYTIPETPNFLQFEFNTGAGGPDMGFPMCKTTGVYDAGNLGPYFGILESGGQKYLSYYIAGWNYAYAVPDNTWITIKVELLGSNTYSVYLDGVKRLDGIAYYSAQTAIDAIHFNSSNATYYFDDFTIDDGEAAEEEEPLQVRSPRIGLGTLPFTSVIVATPTLLPNMRGGFR